MLHMQILLLFYSKSRFFHTLKQLFLLPSLNFIVLIPAWHDLPTPLLCSIGNLGTDHAILRDDRMRDRCSICVLCRFDQIDFLAIIFLFHCFDDFLVGLRSQYRFELLRGDRGQAFVVFVKLRNATLVHLFYFLLYLIPVDRLSRILGTLADG